MMRWSIHPITSSPHFPHGNAHAEKAIHVVKQIYMKADDIKLALLLCKTSPSQTTRMLFKCSCQIVLWTPAQSPSTYKMQTSSYTEDVTSEVPYHVNTALVIRFGLSLTFILYIYISDYLARLSKSYQIKVTTSRWWTVTYFRETNIMSPPDDKVPSGQMCRIMQLRCPNNNNNVPTIYNQGNIKY